MSWDCKVKLAVFVSVLAGLCVVGLDGHFMEEDEPGMRAVVKRLGHEPRMLKPLVDLLPEAERAQLPPDLYLPVGEGTAALCTGCKRALRVLWLVTQVFPDFEKIRWVIEDLCQLAFGQGSAVSQEVCPGLIKNYGPHVAFIVRTMALSPTAACFRMNYCIDKALMPDEPDKPESMDKSTDESMVDYDEPMLLESWAQRASHVIDLLHQPTREDTRFRRDAASSRDARVKRHQEQLDNAIKVVQVTDFHVDEKYFEGTISDCNLPVCCRNDSKGGTISAGRWGTAANCNIPPRTIELFLRHAVDLDPHFVIFSGDNPPHSAWEETRESQLAVSQWAARTVDEIVMQGKKVYTYPNIGNHDTNPTNLYSMIDDIHNGTMEEFNREWGKAWQPAAGFEPEQLATINKAGYYTMKVQGYEDLRLVAFNSNYGYTDNYYNMLNFDRPEYQDMMDWVSRTLTAARKAKEKVIMLSHHDMGKFENIIEFDHNITRILAEFRDIIVFHPVGHTHRDEFRLYFGDDKDEPAGVMLVGQTMNSWPYVNPGYRLFYLDNETYQVLDYDQYFINLHEAKDLTEPPVPEKLYRLTELYDMEDATPASYMDLARRMQQDPRLIEKYYEYQRYLGKPTTCDTKCQVSELCQAVSQAYDIHLQCVKNLTLSDPPQDSTISTTVGDIATTVGDISTAPGRPFPDTTVGVLLLAALWLGIKLLQ